MFNKIVVGVDGRQGGRDAIALATVLAAPGATIDLVNFYASGSLRGRGTAVETRVAQQERSMEMLLAARDATSVAANVLALADASVGPGLHRLAERGGADLIVVGTTRRGGGALGLLGNDMSATLNGSPCAVSIAPVGYVRRARSSQLARLGQALARPRTAPRPRPRRRRRRRHLR
jgi:nucleotide-binding universal stress UspA family protein